LTCCAKNERMPAKKDFAYFHGVSQHVTLRERVHTTTQLGAASSIAASVLLPRHR
jgi:hypothetical protein